MSVPVVVAVEGATWPVAAAKVAFAPAPEAAVLDFFLDFFFNFFSSAVCAPGQRGSGDAIRDGTRRRRWPYLVPSPDGPEAVHKGYILPQVGVEPKAGRDRKVSDAEENDAEDGHEKEEAQQAQQTPAEVVYSLAELQGPERVQDNDEDDEEGEGGVQLALDLAALPQPGVVHFFLGLLLLLDADVPLTLDALGLFARVLDLADTQGEHAQRKQLKRVLERGAVVNLGQQGVLLASLLVGRRLQDPQGALDCSTC